MKASTFLLLSSALLVPGTVYAKSLLEKYADCFGQLKHVEQQLDGCKRPAPILPKKKLPAGVSVLHTVGAKPEPEKYLFQLQGNDAGAKLILSEKGVTRLGPDGKEEPAGDDTTARDLYRDIFLAPALEALKTRLEQAVPPTPETYKSCFNENVPAHDSWSCNRMGPLPKQLSDDGDSIDGKLVLIDKVGHGGERLQRVDATGKPTN